MKSVSLVGWVVNVGANERTYALELIQYLYPNFRVIQPHDYFPQSENLIFVDGYSCGNLSLWNSKSDKQVICAVRGGEFDFDCTDPADILRLVYSKWGIDAFYLFTEDDIENIKLMELFDFYNFIKPRWVSKDLCLFDETETIVNIHSIIGRGFNEILRFSDRITDENASILEMGFIRFIEMARLKNQEKSKAFLKHKELYRSFYTEFNNDYIALVLSKYRQMTNNKRFKLIWLLSQFSFDKVVGAV